LSFESLWADQSAIGRDPETGGYTRGGWTPTEREATHWFLDQCAARNLTVESDGIGNLIAWWDPREQPASRPGVVTGSHLDSVIDGGAFDGPLGVVSALAAVDRLRAEGFEPAAALGVVALAGGAVAFSIIRRSTQPEPSTLPPSVEVSPKL